MCSAMRLAAWWMAWAMLCGGARGEEGRPGAPGAAALAKLPLVKVEVDAGAVEGELEMWRHTVGHGGINALALPDRVVEGTKRLRPRLIRIFIQEFFRVYPETGKLDWSRLDPYMEALAKTGTKVVAAVTIKPKPLYPVIDQRVWRPTDVGEWQRVTEAMVRRYSVEKPIVTHWEVGNETDIGEQGGAPYLITEAKDYLEYYRMMIEPVLKVYPEAKVGGPAVAHAGGKLLPQFIALCAEQKVRLDFVSWHLYADDPQAHANLVRKYKALLEETFGARRPEMLVTEWSRGFEAVSVEEGAYDPRRAAGVAATIMAMAEAGVDYSFYYHLWDQTAYLDDFRPFFKDVNIMFNHWNQVPHRFGLFGVSGEVRPAYFVYQMIGRLGERRVKASCEAKGLHLLAGRSQDGRRVAVMVANYGPGGGEDRVMAVRFAGLEAGVKRLAVYRIDRAGRWSGERLELAAVEEREVDTPEAFMCQVYCPADSVGLVVLEGK